MLINELLLAELARIEISGGERDAMKKNANKWKYQNTKHQMREEKREKQL